MLEAIATLSFSRICRMVADTGDVLFSEMEKSVLEVHAVLFLRYNCLLILDNKYIQLRAPVSLFFVIE